MSCAVRPLPGEYNVRFRLRGVGSERTYDINFQMTVPPGVSTVHSQA